MKFIDMFSGIGGFGYGVSLSGHECVAFAEVDNFAHNAYNLLHNKSNSKTAWKDVYSVTNEELLNFKDVDLITAGFPCQSFSIAGERKGFSDNRGVLFFEIIRWASIIKPKFLLLENVKGLLNHDKGRTFGKILITLDELGYDAEWRVLNSKNFGVPQSRERLFIIGSLREQC